MSVQPDIRLLNSKGQLRPEDAIADSISSVVHVTSWLSRQGGGIPPVVWALARQTRLLDISCTVAGLSDQWTINDCPAQDIPFIAGAVKGPKTFGYSSDLFSRVRSLVEPGSVVHSHGLWMHPGVVARKCARVVGCPLVVSPHGMLEPWALENSRWKKRVAALMFENRNLREADCLHALCEAEARNIRDYGLRNPIAIVPNGVDLEEFRFLPPYEAIEADHPLLKSKRRMLFLSRIHPKKGLPHLLRAWQRVAPEFKDWMLLIAGNDQLGHEQEMRSLAIELGLGDIVDFIGPLYGEAKKRTMAGSDAFVLPSFSEGFSMAVLEAAACGLPVLLTPQCNFPQLAAAGGAVEVQPDVTSCEKGLRQLLSLSNEQRKAMGACGREMIRKAHTWPAITEQMTAAYAWLLRRGPKPDCVRLN